MIRGVLLIPEEGDPAGLLKGAPCGARPPIAYKRVDWSGGGWCDAVGPPGIPEALALAWEGKPIPDGLDRLRRRTRASWVEDAIMSLLAHGWQQLPARQLLHADVPEHLRGRLAFVDGDGYEVSPEDL